MAQKVGTIYAEIDLDASRYIAGQQTLLKSATSTSLSIEQNFKNLGIKSDNTFDLMRQKAINSYEMISGSAKASADDRIRAEQALASQLTKIQEQQFGVQKSFIDQIKTHWMGAIAAMYAAQQALSFAKTFLDAGIAAESMSKGLAAALGSVNEATSATKFLRAESERLGLVFMDQVASYKSLAAAARGTSMEGEQTRKIFTAITTASTALGLSADQTNGSLNAIQQMMSKGNVQAEELRSQLGERLPGAFNMAAEAMGVTTQELNKMLKDGDVLATDLLPKLADVLLNRYGAAATEAANLTQANLNRMSTAYTDLKVAIIDDFLPAISSTFEAITNLLRLFPNLSKAIDMVKADMISFSDVATANGKELNALVNEVDPLTLKIKLLKAEIAKKADDPFDNMGQGVAELKQQLQKLEMQAEGVTTQTGQWAQGVVRMNAALDARMSKGDLWQSFFPGMNAADERGAKDYFKAVEDGYKAEEAAAKKAEIASNKAATELKRQLAEAEKVAVTYAKALESAVDAYNKLTLSTSEYQRLEIWKWYEKESQTLGVNNEYLLAARDLKLQNVDATEKIIAANKAYAENPLPADPWIKHFADKEKLAADADKEIAKASLKETDKLTKDLEDIYESMWKNIQSSFSDTIYNMLDGQMQTWDDFFDGIFDAFKRMLANMASAMIAAEIASWWKGTASPIGSFLSGTESTGSGTGAGAVGTGVSSVSTLASLYKFFTSVPEYYATAASWIGSLGSTAETSVAAFQALEASIEATKITAAATSTTVGSSAGSAGGGASVAGAAGALAAVMYFVSSDTFRNLYYGGTKSSYEVLREDERTGYAQLDPDMRDWLKADLLNSAAVNYGLQSIVKDFDSFVAAHKELLSMTMDKFDYLLGEQSAFYASTVDTSGTLSNTLAGFTINYNSDAAVKLAVDIANDAQLTLEEKMYQLGFIATASGGWETEAVVAMVAELSNDGVPWSKIQSTMNSYGVPTTGQSNYGMGGMATGGQYGDDPFIVGEKGWEIVNPRTRTVLSHEQSLKAMGMKGYEEGTDPFLDLIGMANNAGDVGASTSTTASGSAMTWDEFWADYRTETEKMLKLNTDLGDSLTEINDYYAEQTQKATELNATQEALSEMEAVRLALRRQAIEEWAQSEFDYYNEMMGLNTDLGSSLSEIADHYKEAVKNARDAGATQEQLDAIVAAGMAVGQKAVDDWAKGVYAYYNNIMGYTGSLESALSENSDQWEKFINEAISAGASVEQLTAMYQAQAATITKINQAWAQGAIDPFLQLVSGIYDWAAGMAGITKEAIALNELMVYRASRGFSANGAGDIWNTAGMSSDQVKDYVVALSSYFGAVTQGLEATYTALNQSRDSILASRDEIMLSGMTGQQQSDYYKKKASEEFYALAGLSSEDVPAAIDQMHSDLMKYYDLEKANIQDKYKTEIDALQEKHDVEMRNIEAIQNKLLSLRYSNFNLALPTAKAAAANQDYNALFAAAQTDDADAISKYLSFTDTALQASMDANKSSQTYLDFYQKVMADIASLDTSGGQSIESLTQIQTDEITRLNDDMAAELAALDSSVTEALSYMTSGLEMRIQETTTAIADIYNLLARYVQQAYDPSSTSKGSLSDSADQAFIDFSEWIKSDFSKGLYEWAINDLGYQSFVKSSMQAWFGNDLAFQDWFKGAFTGGLYEWASQETQSLKNISDGLNAWALNYVNFITWFKGDYTTGQYAWATAEQNSATQLYNLMAAFVADAMSYTAWYKGAWNNGIFTWASSELSVLGKIYSASAALNHFGKVPGYAEGGIVTSPTLGMIAEAGYPEAVIPMKNGYVPVQISGGGGDPETKALLKQLVAQGAQKQRVTMVLDNGRELSGYIRAEADAVRVEANERKGVERRRLYN